MKALIISDVHSNIEALNAVYEKEKDSNVFYCAGDVVDYGFSPCEVIKWFREHNVIAVSGNHDRGMVEMSKTMAKPEKETADSFPNYNLACLGKEDLAYLDALPLELRFELDGIAYYMKHSYDEVNLHAVAQSLIDYQSVSLFEKIWAEKMSDYSAAKKRRIIFGHTHRCCLHLVKRDSYWLNPGSIAFRLDDDRVAKGADYIIIQDGEFSLRHVDYSTERLAELTEKSAFCDWQRGIGHDIFDPEV